MEPLNYTESGSGNTVMLIHGFPMNQQMWNDFAEKLSASCHVITLDLPGFGKSAGLQPGFTIDDVSREVINLIRARNYTTPIVVGHSLGGYVALAMAEQQPDLMAGFCLFHSTALADSAEKKESRNKALDFIRDKGVHAFTSNFIGQLYVDPQHSSITKVKTIAVQSSRETVEGYTLAMRDRPDRTHVVSSFQKPILFLAGEKDQVIPLKTIHEQAASNPLAEVVVLPETAHMGMFESDAACLKNILAFVRKCVVTF